MEENLSAYSFIHSVELKIVWFYYVIWWSGLKMHNECGQIEESSLKGKRREKKRFPMMQNLNEECKILNLAVKFKYRGLKFKWLI